MTVNGYNVNSPGHNLDKLKAMIKASTSESDLNIDVFDNNVSYTKGQDSFTVMGAQITDKQSESRDLRFQILTDNFNVNNIRIGDGFQVIKDNLPQICSDRANNRVYVAYGDAVLSLYYDKDTRLVNRMVLAELVK